MRQHAGHIDGTTVLARARSYPHPDMGRVVASDWGIRSAKPQGEIVFDEPLTALNANAARPRGSVRQRLARTIATSSAGVATLALPASMTAIIAAGAALRFWDINALGYNSDEAVYTGQAAALAGDPDLSTYFPIFRAHPMVFQFTLSVAFSLFGVHDIIGRSLVALIGLVTIWIVYRIGSELYGPWTGVVAAALMALMPYHVIVTRQVLLDGPLTFCTTLTLLMLVRYARTGKAWYLMAVGAGLGLTFLTKETGFVLAGAAFAFLALSPEIRIRFWPLVAAGVSMMVPIMMFPISIALAGRSDTAQSYLVWQLLRRSNHPWNFFPTVVPPAMGWLVLITAVSSLLLLRKQHSWRETLLVCWIVVPTVVFQLWPVKGFQYLLPIAPAVSMLVARLLVSWRPSLRWPRTGFPLLNAAMTIVVLLSLMIPSLALATNQDATSRLAGAGGIPGVRETGLWVDQNLPEDAVLATIGPSMANMMQFYGNRRAYGLSVSTNPLHRNPSYKPIANPDASFRYGDVQYLVYDSFSASRSEFFTQTLYQYVDKYDAREIYSYSIPTPDHPEGTKIIIIYEVRP